MKPCPICHIPTNQKDICVLCKLDIDPKDRITRYMDVKAKMPREKLTMKDRAKRGRENSLNYKSKKKNGKSPYLFSFQGRKEWH